MTCLKMSVLTRVGLNFDAQGPAIIIKRTNLDLPEDVGLDQGWLELRAAQRPAIIGIKHTNLNLPEDVGLNQGWLELRFAEARHHQDKV